MDFENIKRRFDGPAEQLANFVTFPLRAVIQNPNKSSDKFMCLRDERMFYVAQHCRGRVLDVGCGPGNMFVTNFYDGEGEGIDFHLYPGLEEHQVVDPPLPFPFEDASFDTVTLIANVNHIPTSIIQDEFEEIGRVLRPGGRLVVTRIGLVVSFLTHNIVKVQSMISDEYYDMDTERGVEEDERYTVTRKEIGRRAKKAGLKLRSVHPFWTQWFLNEVLIFEKL